MIDANSNILLIYTGGTIGMVENMKTGALEPFNFGHLSTNFPEINKLNFNVETHLFDPPIDSSDMSLYSWQQIVKVIENNYDSYDGFVILHGTDTMAYTASALSFMCENLTKPVILTGSQLPIGKLRTDGKENLITALEIAADKNSDKTPRVPEVSIYMQNLLMRGNRTTKVNADNFSAFRSPNCSVLAETGIEFRYNIHEIIEPDFNQKTSFNYSLNPNMVILNLFPGINPITVKAHLNIPDIKGLILKTYGTGNSPLFPWFTSLLEDAISNDIVILNVTQCPYGSVEMQRYKNGQMLESLGVISGHDITTEAAIAKMMHLFGRDLSSTEVKRIMQIPLCGEMAV